MRHETRVLAGILLCIAVFCSLIPVGYAEERTLHIGSAEELIDFSKKCSLDTWSDGLTVILDRDLSLSGTDFRPIPIFNGIFDGQNHTIFDVSLELAQSPCGLFLETGTEAQIMNLGVSGSVCSTADDSMIGGIAGLNRGQIINCTFTGNVSGKDQIGGIAGKNAATGMLTGCTSYGTVFGLNATGGIAGNSEGALNACISNCLVNTESVDPSLRLDAIDTSSILNFIKTLTTDNAGITSDIGGVAGLSTGFMELCQNNGTVGYLHLGYNIGGIAGRSSGYINECINHGDVYGRRDVGGIAGQAEPLIEVTEAQNLLANLSYAFYSLNESVQGAINDAGGFSDALVGQLSVLPGYLLPVADAFSGIDITDPDSLGSLQDAISSSMYQMSGELNNITANMDGSSDVLIEDMEKIRDNMNALSYTAMQALTILSGAEESDVLVDESDTEADSVILGKIKNCVSTGRIYGDSNVGAIAGSISLEDGLDPDQDLGGDPSSLVRNRFSFKAVIIKCTARGSVTAKRECAGGIVGRMDFGYVANCAVYTSVSIEDGGYAGGVCGLSYATIKNCCAKCSVSGKKYVGGIVGNGYTGKGGEENDRSSLVRGCYTLAEIRNDPQFAGAVAGGSDGVYEENFFVDAGYAGIDKLSIHGKAEPISFEAFRAVKGIPEEATHFTLRFVLEGETVKELPFEYGASFDRSVFPAVEKRDSAYAVWDRTDLRDLRFDTIVTAEYRLDESVLRSAESREDGRAVLYVDGQFQHGDTIEVTGLPITAEDSARFTGSWRETARRQLRTLFREHRLDTTVGVYVEEKLLLSLPNDGLETHSVRYLTPDGETRNYDLFLLNGEEWEKLRPETFGSYYLFTVPGREAEILLVSTMESWWFISSLLAMVLLLSSLFWAASLLLRKGRVKVQEESVRKREAEHRRALMRVWKRIRTPLLCVLLAVASVALLTVGLLRTDKVSEGISAWKLLSKELDEETDLQAEVVITKDGRKETVLSALLHRVRAGENMITCTDQYGVPIFLYRGTLYLENGKAFTLTDSFLDQSALLSLSLDVFRHGEIRRIDTGSGTRFEAEVTGDALQPMMRTILGSAYSGLPPAESVTAAVFSEGNTLKDVVFTGCGDGFDFEAKLRPVPMEEKPHVPQAVLNVLERSGSPELHSEDFLRLLTAWVRNGQAETAGAEIYVKVEGGILDLDTDYTYLRQRIEGIDVHCLKGALFTVYFTEDAACTENGGVLNTAENQMLSTADLIHGARTLCLQGGFTCEGSGSRYTYTISLDADGAKALACSLIPELAPMNITYQDCSLILVLEEDTLARIELVCGGTLRIVSREVETTIDLSLRYKDAPAPEPIPEAVRAVLLAAG